jgi:hypothetical protein
MIRFLVRSPKATWVTGFLRFQAVRCQEARSISGIKNTMFCIIAIQMRRVETTIAYSTAKLPPIPGETCHPAG